MKHLSKNKILIFLCFSLLFLISQFTDAIGSEAIPNIQVIRQKLIRTADSIITRLSANKCDTIYSSIKTKKSERFFNSILIERASNVGFSFFIGDLNSDKRPYVEFHNSIVTEYINDGNNADSLYRQIDFEYSGSITFEDGGIIALNFELQRYRDKISRKDAERNNETSFDFAKAKIPDPPASFWKDIIQPVTIVSAAVITVVLLFTMRSN
jgi:hypothetical protein